jgi:hypothetical protein
VPAVLLLRDSRRCQVANGCSIPGLASAFSTVIRATRSDPKSDVGKGKAPPSRRFKSVRCRSQNACRTCPSMSRLDRIETTILDVPRQKGAIQSRPTRVPSGNRDSAASAAFSRTSHQRGTTGTGTCCALATAFSVCRRTPTSTSVASALAHPQVCAPRRSLLLGRSQPARCDSRSK